MFVATTLKDPRRYFEGIDAARSEQAETPPVCLYLEVTNRCNLLCETCPRTFETLEPPADMSWDLFTTDRRPGARRRARGAARRRRADAGQGPAAHGPLPQGPRNLRLVQHQRHAAAAEALRRADRHGTRRAARVPRCRRPRVLPARPRQGLFRSHRPGRRPVHRLPEVGRRLDAARLAVADGPQGDGGAVAGLRPAGRDDRRCARCTCNGSSSTRAATAWHGPTCRCSRARGRRRRRRSPAAQALGATSASCSTPRAPRSRASV